MGEGPAFEGGVGGVAVEADGHADVDLGDGDADCEDEGGGRGEVVEGGGGEEQCERGQEGGHDDDAVQSASVLEVAQDPARGEEEEEGFQVEGREVLSEGDDGEGDVDSHADLVYLHAAGEVPWPSAAGFLRGRNGAWRSWLGGGGAHGWLAGWLGNF